MQSFAMREGEQIKRKKEEIQLGDEMEEAAHE